MVKVYSYRTYNHQKRIVVSSLAKATAAWIAKAGTEIAPGTEQEVSEIDLDANGVYCPRQSGDDIHA